MSDSRAVMVPEIGRLTEELAVSLKRAEEAEDEIFRLRHGTGEGGNLQIRTEPYETLLQRLEKVERERDELKAALEKEKVSPRRCYLIGHPTLDGDPERFECNVAVVLRRERDEAKEKLFDQNMAAKKSGYEDGKREERAKREKAEEERDSAQVLYRTERELRKKAEDMLHLLDTGTQAEAVQGEAAWRERALVGEKALEDSRAAQVALAKGLEQVARYAGRTNSAAEKRLEAVQVLNNLTPAAARMARIVKAAEDFEKMINRGGFDALTIHPLTIIPPRQTRTFCKAAELEVLVKAVRGEEEEEKR